MLDRLVNNLKEKWKFYFVVFLLIICFFLWYQIIISRESNLKIAFLDVGQGDSIFIESPAGNKIIFDGGPGDILLRQVSKQMTFFDRTIDMVLVTNPDKDHFEGFISLFEKYEIPAFLSPGIELENNSLYQELLNRVKEEGSLNLKALKGQRIDLGGEVFIDIIFPDRDVSNISHNEGSVVAKLTYGKVSVLLMGDSTKNIEKYLVDKGENLDVDIIKIGHHGSKTSTTDELIKASSPDIAIIQAGKDNTYGHPHQEVLDVLNKNKVPFLGTYNEGNIVFESDGENVWRVD